MAGQAASARAIQLARLWGAEVFATAGTAEKCAACESLGATRAINYRETEFAESIRTATDGRGVDVILDMVGGPYLSSNLESLAPEGRLVVIGLMGGTAAEVDLATLMSRRLVLTGSTLRSRSISQKGAIVDAVRAQVWPWIADARFRPVIHERYSLDDAAEAHGTMEASNTSGNSCSCPSVASVHTLRRRPKVQTVCGQQGNVVIWMLGRQHHQQVIANMTGRQKVLPNMLMTVGRDRLSE